MIAPTGSSGSNYGLRRTAPSAFALVFGLGMLSGVPVSAQNADPPTDRIQVKDFGDVRVSVAVPDAGETEAHFGSDLYDVGIQPVWLRIDNGGDVPLYFLPASVDDDYLSPTEVYVLAGGESRDVDAVTEFESLHIPLELMPGESQAGFVFSLVDEGTKTFNVILHGRGERYTMTFYVPVPGLRIDHYAVDFGTLYAPEQIDDVDLDGLASQLAAFPCCVTDQRGRNDGDPLNIAFVGTLDEVYHALLRAGWDETETAYGGSLIRMLRSLFRGDEYRYSPVSALYVFDRPQDAAFQKARANISERNHLRIWLTAMRYNGRPVWIGQISRDIGVRLNRRTLVTHKIDPDVDETREYLLEDLAYAQAIEAYGYVGGVGPAPVEAPRGNLTGDPYFTDGRRLVLFVSDGHVDIGGLESLELAAQR